MSLKDGSLEDPAASVEGCREVCILIYIILKSYNRITQMMLFISSLTTERIPAVPR